MNTMKISVFTISGMAEGKHKIVPEITVITEHIPECEEEEPYASVKKERFVLRDWPKRLPGKSWTTQLLEQAYAEQVLYGPDDEEE